MKATEIHARRYEGAIMFMCNRPHEFHFQQSVPFQQKEMATCDECKLAAKLAELSGQ